MKKIFLAMVLALCFCSSVSAAEEGVYGVIYKNATEPGVGFSTANPVKTGEATCTSVFGIVAVGNCSVNKAAQKAEINNISYYDIHTLNILGFKRLTVRAYGE